MRCKNCGATITWVADSASTAAWYCGRAWGIDAVCVEDDGVRSPHVPDYDLPDSLDRGSVERWLDAP